MAKNKGEATEIYAVLDAAIIGANTITFGNRYRLTYKNNSYSESSFRIL